jgi:predicted PurR-regulated permease PerM
VAVNLRLWFILSGFFLLAAIGYVVWNIVYDAQQLATDPNTPSSTIPVEWAGTTGLFLAAVFAGLIGFYLARTYRAQGGELVEDIPTANIEDGDAEQGFYSPWSWWPIALAAGLALTFLGIAAGVWIAFIGAPIAAIAIVGLIFEYYRGNFAH